MADQKIETFNVSDFQQDIWERIRKISTKIVKTIINEEILKDIQVIDKTNNNFRFNSDLFNFHIM